MQVHIDDEEREVDEVVLPVGDLSLRTMLWRMLIGVVLLFVGALALAVLLQDPLTALSLAFVERFGLLGVGVGVVITDTFMLTHEPLLFAAHAGGLDFWATFGVASGASMLAGLLGWVLGNRLGRLALVQRLFERYRLRAFLQRYGFWAVAIAALTPFPYSAATWASGAAGVSLRTVVIGSLFRAPKVLFYFLLIVVGWDLGAALVAP
ncbi:MAG: VTT domain-containing protein [Alphaproteobacteria bacterium]|nr:VTT domain-containing protein [Alphaproteobacteria bacterium]